MNPSEAVTLEAFLVALCRLDTELPEDLQHEVHQLGEAMARHETEAIANIPDLVQQHTQLHELYRVARLVLQQQVQIQRMGLLPSRTSNSLAVTLQEMAAQILTTDDFKAAAYYQIRRAIARSDFRNAPADIKRFLEALRKAVLTLDKQAIAVLEALERRPLSVENLSYMLQLPPEQLQAMIQYLWSAGYIDSTRNNMLHRIFPALQQLPNLQIADPSSVTYFTLTAKGHFYLHPLVTPSGTGV